MLKFSVLSPVHSEARLPETPHHIPGVRPHGPAERPSAVARLLGEHCRLPVAEALDKQPIEAGTITLAPPDYHMLVEPDRRISLSLDEPVMFATLQGFIDGCAEQRGLNRTTS